MAAGQGAWSFKRIMRGLAKYVLGVREEYLAAGARGIGQWFLGMTVNAVRDSQGKVTYKIAQRRVPMELLKRYGGLSLRIGAIYAGIRLPFWLVSLPFKAGDGLMDYTRRRLV